MRINSCPVAHPCFLCHFLKSSSFISNAPTPHVASRSPFSRLPPLYCTCLSNALDISRVLFILHPHPLTVYRYSPSSFKAVVFWQRCIAAEVALNLGEVTLSCLLWWWWGGAAWQSGFRGEGLVWQPPFHMHTHSITHKHDRTYMQTTCCFFSSTSLPISFPPSILKTEHTHTHSPALHPKAISSWQHLLFSPVCLPSSTLAHFHPIHNLTHNSQGSARCTPHRTPLIAFHAAI